MEIFCILKFSSLGLLQHLYVYTFNVYITQKVGNSLYHEIDWHILSYYVTVNSIKHKILGNQGLWYLNYYLTLFKGFIDVYYFTATSSTIMYLE